MNRFIIVIFLSINYIGFSQKGYLNEDGTISNKAYRESMVEAFNNNSTDDTTYYDIEDKYFVVITKADCGKRKLEPNEMQELALYSSFLQLLNQISGFKRMGYDKFTDFHFQGIIFKTNTICMSKTRRYHFKFKINELEKLPEYLDISELQNYVLIENKNKNIIYVKNPKD